MVKWKSILVALSLFSLSHPVYSQDEQEWWFDVEIAVFKRNLSPSLNEDFSAADFEFSNADAIDLMSLAILRQQGFYDFFRTLPVCNAPVTGEIIQVEELDYDASALEINLEGELLEEQEVQLAPIELEASIVNTFNMRIQEVNLSCFDESLPVQITKVPTQVFNESEYPIGQNAIIGQDDLRMQDFVSRVFSHREHQALLYTIWRQQVVFGENNASFYRIFAGEKLTIPSKSPAFDDPTIEEEQESKEEFNAFIQKIDDALKSPEPVEWENSRLSEKSSDLEHESGFSAFELEGLFKVYLQYVGRIPYLHIDAEFKHYRMNLDADGEANLSTYPFKQRRRIISKQIHYFDHPAFGIVVRLHRYEPPVADKSGGE